MNNMTIARMDTPVTKYHQNQIKNRFPKPVIPMEKYYKNNSERERELDQDVYALQSYYKVD